VRASKLLADARRALRAAPSLEHYARQEAIESRELLAYVLGHTPAPSDQVGERDASRFEELIARRLAGETVALIRGWERFRGLEIRVHRGVFVPRESTSLLADAAVRRLRGRAAPVAVDVATGSGAVALAIANEVPAADVVGGDISPEAIRIARANAQRLGLSVGFVVADGLAPLAARLGGGIDVVTLHPPYVPIGEVNDLPLETRLSEPLHTLSDGSEDGMQLIRDTAEAARGALKPRGWLAIEVSSDVSRTFATIVRRAGLRDVLGLSRPMHDRRVMVGRR
jgi:release factor glutamine methyltransferase